MPLPYDQALLEGGLSVLVFVVVSTNNENYNEEIDLDVEFVPDSEIEESQHTAENHEHDGNDDSMEVIPETQTQVIPETQGIGNTQTVPETQTFSEVIVIDD